MILNRKEPHLLASISIQLYIILDTFNLCRCMPF